MQSKHNYLTHPFAKSYGFQMISNDCFLLEYGEILQEELLKEVILCQL